MPRFCPRCGNATDDRYVFCGFCGQPLEQPLEQPAAPTVPEPSIPMIQSPSPVQPAPKKKKRTPLIIGLVAVAVIAAVAAAVLLIFFSGADKPQSPQDVLDRIIDTSLDGDYARALDYIYEFHYSENNKEDALSLLSSDQLDSLRDFGVDKETVKSLIILKVNSYDEASPHDDAAIRQELEDNGITTDPIEKIVMADVTFDLMSYAQSVNLFFVKADGSWYLLSSGEGMTSLVPSLQ